VPAFKNEPASKLVVVAINENEGAQNLELRFAAATVRSMTPCRTPEMEDLVTWADVQVADNALRSPLAPASVTSFVATVTPAQCDRLRGDAWAGEWDRLRGDGYAGGVKRRAILARRPHRPAC